MDLNTTLSERYLRMMESSVGFPINKENLVREEGKND